ncbi:MAG: hypothetical protein Q8P41_02375 [Pseudomonadota bacterium]|nr:hypothetical protein [Pseudomonadota bacterium]
MSRVRPFLLALLLVPAAADAGSADALGIVGSWSVVSTFESSTCGKPNDTGGTDAYSWLVSADESGAYNVAVQGATGYPRLTGKADGPKVRLTGLENGGTPGTANVLVSTQGDLLNDPRSIYRLGRSDLELSLKDGALTGKRTVMIVEGPVAGQSASIYAGCRIEYAVVAKRM